MSRFQIASYSLAATLLASASLLPGLVSAQPVDEIQSAAHSYVDTQARQMMLDPRVVDAIKAQNSAHADLQQMDIDKLDKVWRQESATGSGPMIDQVLGNALSLYLKSVQEESQGLITEVFVMDNKGLNVGQSDVTSDFWQGDEGKWQKTYSMGPDAVFVDDVEMDESSQRFQTQASFSIVDPATGEVIGAVTFGIDAEGLLML